MYKKTVILLLTALLSVSVNAQAFAVCPGISRSGSTIATGLISGVERGSMAQSSFLMVLIPILGESAR